jgi:hypothetical protein
VLWAIWLPLYFTKTISWQPCWRCSLQSPSHPISLSNLRAIYFTVSMARASPTAILKTRAEAAEARVLELQGTTTCTRVERYMLMLIMPAQLEQAQNDSATAKASAQDALASVEDMRDQINTLTSSNRSAATTTTGPPHSTLPRGHLIELDIPPGVDANVHDGSIPKPAGSGRKGYNLMDKMGLSRQHKQFYNRIRVLPLSPLPHNLVLLTSATAHYLSECDPSPA